jgi:hypothetical protein
MRCGFRAKLKRRGCEHGNGECRRGKTAQYGAGTLDELAPFHNDLDLRTRASYSLNPIQEVDFYTSMAPTRTARRRTGRAGACLIWL